MFFTHVLTHRCECAGISMFIIKMLNFEQDVHGVYKNENNGTDHIRHITNASLFKR